MTERPSGRTSRLAPFVLGALLALPGIALAVTGMSQKEFLLPYVNAQVDDPELQARIDEARESYRRNLAIGGVLVFGAFLAITAGIRKRETQGAPVKLRIRPEPVRVRARPRSRSR